jgi:hypothetical protein
VAFFHAAGEVKLRVGAASFHDEAGVVHVGDEAERLAAGGVVVVMGVEIAEFVQAGGDVGQAGETFQHAGADMAFVAGGGRADGDGHAGLVKFLVEDVHGFRL